MFILCGAGFSKKVLRIPVEKIALPLWEIVVVFRGGSFIWRNWIGAIIISAALKSV